MEFLLKKLRRLGNCLEKLDFEVKASDYFELIGLETEVKLKLNKERIIKI